MSRSSEATRASADEILRSAEIAAEPVRRAARPGFGVPAQLRAG